MKTKQLPEINHLAELIGQFIEYWGFKQIHGKVWIHLYLSSVPLDAQDLMEKLNISKALVSITLKDLLHYNVILELGNSGHGTRTYGANPELSKVIELVLRQRERMMMNQILVAFSQLKKLPANELMNNQVSSKKIKELEKFINRGEKSLDTLMAFL
ncbi:MAG: GbsR/MarR family transcriptional regulator [Bacteriovoracaceae bacterium]